MHNAQFTIHNSQLNESGAVGGGDPEYLECLFVFGELLEVALGEGFLYLGGAGGVDKGDAGPFEACA